jgi:hypothetical protein
MEGSVELVHRGELLLVGLLAAGWHHLFAQIWFIAYV